MDFVDVESFSAPVFLHYGATRRFVCKGRECPVKEAVQNVARCGSSGGVIDVFSIKRADEKLMIALSQ